MWVVLEKLALRWVEVEGELLMCHNHGSVIIDDTELWVVGGGGNCFSFGTHYNEVFKFDISKFLV